jgi:Tol biopolymer transport system component
MRTPSLCVLSLLGLATLAGCDDRREALAHAGPKPAYAEQSDSSTLTTRRVWNGAADRVSVTADGRRVVYTEWDTGNVAIRDLQTGVVRNITHNLKPYEPGYGLSPIFSRDGKWVAYGWYTEHEVENHLRIAGVDGSEPRVVYNAKTGYMQPEDWSPDGRTILAGRLQDAIWQIVLVQVADGSVRVLKSLDWRAPLRMNFSPDGRFVVYDFPTTQESSRDRDIFVLDLASGQEHRLVENAANDFVLGWGPDGNHVLFASDRGGTLGAWLQAVEDGRAKGAPVLVKSDVWNAKPGQFASDGSYFYGVEAGTREVYLATLDPRSGKVVGGVSPISASPHGMLGNPQWSPDGRSVSYLAARTGTTPVITIRSVESGAVREIPVPHELVYSTHRWFSDGRSLALTGVPKGRRGLFRMDLQSAKTEPLFMLEPEEYIPGARAFELMPGDSTVVMSKVMPTKGSPTQDLLVRNLRTQAERILYHPKEILGVALSVSHDGRQVAFTEGLRPAQLKVVSLEGGSPRRVGETFIARTHSPVAWSADGRSIFAVSAAPTGNLNTIWRLPVDGGAPDSIGVTAETITEMRLDATGRRLLFIAGNPVGELWVMEHILPDGKRTVGAIR